MFKHKESVGPELCLGNFCITAQFRLLLKPFILIYLYWFGVSLASMLRVHNLNTDTTKYTGVKLDLTPNGMD
jgi:hypothetical protein